MSSEIYNVPILFLIFNRPDTTKKVFNEIRKIKPKYLYVAADGPREYIQSDFDLCQQSREIVVQNIDWDCKVETLFRKDNQGCKKAVSQAITWFFTRCSAGVILEDDCLPTNEFFWYCKWALKEFEKDDRIVSVSGFNFGYENPTISFSRFMNMWGWASWSKYALNIDYNIEKWDSLQFKKYFLIARLYRSIFQLDKVWTNYWYRVFNKIANNELDTWDYQWIFYQLSNNMLTVVPPINLIQNVGFHEEGTHTKSNDHPIAKIVSDERKYIWGNLKFKVSPNYYFEEKYIKEVWCDYSVLKETYLSQRISYTLRLKIFIKKIFDRIISVFSS